MKDILFLFFMIALVTGFIYIGHILVTGKSLQSSVNQLDTLSSQVTVKQHQQETQDLWKKQRELMEVQQQRIRDLQKH